MNDNEYYFKKYLKYKKKCLQIDNNLSHDMIGGGENTLKGSFEDFIDLFKNIDYNLNADPKTTKKTKKYMDFINSTNLKPIFDLPKTFTFNKKVKEIITREESYDNYNTIKFKVKNNKVNILDYLHNIYLYFKKEDRDHIFLEGISGDLDGNVLNINIYFGS